MTFPPGGRWPKGPDEGKDAEKTYESPLAIAIFLSKYLYFPLYEREKVLYNIE
jgi:hypothetical protein